jgi:hypothetical protein
VISRFFTNELLHKSGPADKGKVWGHLVPEVKKIVLFRLAKEAFGRGAVGSYPDGATAPYL